MKSRWLLPITLLPILLTGCFGSSDIPKINATTLTNTVEPIITSQEATQVANQEANQDSNSPSVKSTSSINPDPLVVDMQQEIAVHARIREILTSSLQSQQQLPIELQLEFNTLLDQSGPLSAADLQHYQESLIGIHTSYKLYSYEDSLASLQAGTYVKSEARSIYEAYLQDMGAISEQKINENDELIQRISLKLPIPYNENNGVVIDQAILEILIANQKKTNLRIDRIFDNYLSTSTSILTMKPEEEILIEPEDNTSPLPEPEAVLEVVTPTPTTPITFQLGSTAEEVEAVMGKPDWIQNYKYKKDEWQYGQSYVRFDADFRVNGYNNKDGNLKILMNQIDPDAQRFIKGSSQQEVAAYIGIPDAVLHYNSAGSSWSYGKSRVDFDKTGSVKGWINSADFDLFD